MARHRPCATPSPEHEFLAALKAMLLEEPGIGYLYQEMCEQWPVVSYRHEPQMRYRSRQRVIRPASTD